jgi:hypothetical protein
MLAFKGRFHIFAFPETDLMQRQDYKNGQITRQNISSLVHSCDSYYRIGCLSAPDRAHLSGKWIG